MHICHFPCVKKFIAETGGHLSNGVPRALRMHETDGYLLGVYSPDAFAEMKKRKSWLSRLWPFSNSSTDISLAS